MANEQFMADVNSFCKDLENRCEYVAFGTAKELHTRLVEITPYRSGRARASWNLSPNKSDNAPAPDIGLSGPFASPAELRQANVFFDSIIAAKARQGPEPALVWHVTNTVHYIEDLNNGRSRQAPAGFFQAIVYSAGQIVSRVVNGIRV